MAIESLADLVLVRGGHDMLAPVPRIKATVPYEGASTSRRMATWNPTTENINSLLNGGSDILRARCRDIARKNPYAVNALNSFVGNVISTGIKPQSQHPNRKIKEEIQKAWLRWTDESDADGISDFYGQQSLAVRAAMEGGECFVRLRYRLPEDGLSVPLQLQVLESEHVPATYNENLPGGNKIRAGIEFNQIGRRVAYHMYREHPGASHTSFFGDTSKLTRVSAAEILHLYPILRPGQMRGQPWLAPVLAKLYEIDQYDDATLVAQKIAAMFAGFITQMNPDDAIMPSSDSAGTSSSSAGVDFAGMEPGTMQQLLPGEDVKFSDPPSVGQYESFMRVQLRAVAAGLGITEAQLTGDLSNVNYSSIRAGLLEFRRRAEQFQHQVVVFQLCRPVYAAWLKQAVVVGAFRAPRFAQDPQKYLDVKWIAPGWPWVDPLKDISALGLEVLYGFNSRQSVVAQKGDDIEVIDEEQAQDNARADALKIGPYDSDARKSLQEAAKKSALQGTTSERTQDQQDPGNFDQPNVARYQKQLQQATAQALEIIRLEEDGTGDGPSLGDVISSLISTQEKTASAVKAIASAPPAVAAAPPVINVTTPPVSVRVGVPETKSTRVVKRDENGRITAIETETE